MTAPPDAERSPDDERSPDAERSPDDERSPDAERQTGRRLRVAVVLAGAEDACTVFAEGRRAEVPYAQPFPRPRADRVSPGHLVAIAPGPDGGDLVIWRWFDAVVVDCTDLAVTVWEPNHGTVQAQPRDLQHDYLPGSRAYLSAGLPGAEWWVAGPAGGPAEDAHVELGEVEAFFTGHGLWDRST
jgi:hypothetical protein